MTAAPDYIAELCRLYIVVTLAAAAIGKTLATGPFIASTAHLLGLRRDPARYVAFPVIAAEAGIAATLLVGGRMVEAGMIAAMLLFVAFTTVLAVALVRGRTVHCNCFGGRGHKVSAHDLLRNGTLMAAGGWYLAREGSAASLTPQALGLLLGCALFLFLISANLREIQRLLSPLDA